MSVYNNNMYTYVCMNMCSTHIHMQFFVTVNSNNVLITYVVISEMNANIDKLLISNYIITCSSCYLLSTCNH